MKLTLNSDDLAEGVNKDMLPMSVRFSDLNEKAQAAVRAVGEATYHSGNRYSRILPPK
jgi:hypothetical protein